MFPWVFNVYMDTVMKEVKMGMGRRGESEDCLLYANDLVLCGELEEDLRTMVGHFVDVYRRRGLKVNAGKRKVMVLHGEEGLDSEVCVDGIRLEHVLEFKYSCATDKSGTDEAECHRKVGCRWY